jgi:hypothetical protein
MLLALVHEADVSFGIWAKALGAGIGVAALAAGVYAFGQIDADRAAAIDRLVTASASFPVRHDAIDTLFQSLFSFVDEVWSRWRQPSTLRGNVSSLLTFLPLTGLYFALGARIVLTRPRPWHVHALLIALLATCCFGSLLLDLVALDFHRWHAMSQITSFLALMILSRNLTVGLPRSSPWLTAFAAAILLNLNSYQWFFDGKSQEFFPVYKSAVQILHAFASGTEIPTR